MGPVPGVITHNHLPQAEDLDLGYSVRKPPQDDYPIPWEGVDQRTENKTEYMGLCDHLNGGED